MNFERVSYHKAIKPIAPAASADTTQFSGGEAFGVRQLAAALSFEFRVSRSQLKIAGQLGTQNWELGRLKSGSEQPHISEGALRARKPFGIRFASRGNVSKVIGFDPL
jgi:hypothetical protein